MEGKVVKSSTGNDSSGLSRVSWDVSALMGKKAHLEVLDSTTATRHGYIMVDDIRFGFFRYYDIPSDFGIQPQFIPKCRFFQTQEQLNGGRQLPVGLTPKQFDYAINEVYKRMLQPDMDHVPGRSVRDLAGLIKQNTLDDIQRLHLASNPQLLRNWLLAEAVCAWVSTHVVADKALEAAPGPEKFRRAQSDVLLSFNPPAGICAGFSRLTFNLALEMGLNCSALGGEVRNPGITFLGHDNHGWVYFDFGDGIETLADTTGARVNLLEARRINGKTHGDKLLPKSPMDFEMFLSQHYSIQLMGTVDFIRKGTHYKDTTEQALLSLSYPTWGAIDTAYLKSAYERFFVAEKSRLRELNNILNIDDAGI